MIGTQGVSLVDSSLGLTSIFIPGMNIGNPFRSSEPLGTFPILLLDVPLGLQFGLKENRSWFSR